MSASLTRNLVFRDADAAVPASDREQAADVYFVGYPSHLFKTYAPLVLNALDGRVAGVVSDAYVNHFAGMTAWGKRIPLVSTAQLFERAGRGKALEVVHFFESLDQYWAIPGLTAHGSVKVVDFLSKLDALGLLHTYVPVSEEREWWSRQSKSRIGEFAAMFGDGCSRRTLDARIRAITLGDRRPLIEASFPAEFEYFNSRSASASLVPGADEIYVDVGAAHGDTVERFSETVEGRFRRVHAFEPTPSQFPRLSKLAQADSRVRAHCAAVGDTAGKLTFFDHPRNPFAGNALTADVAAVPVEVDCVRLDDVVDECTLIKMDVEGFETRVLGGARSLIASCRPDMAVTCYHYPQDMFEILELVRDMHPYRHVALRHYGPTLHDSVLLFSDRQGFA